MKITIVTVSFNEERNISRTIESVLTQTSSDFEYIICDGKSTDRTVEIAETYREAFKQKNVNYIVNSEKDKGIYDGMNKGLDLANGKYIYFLNAGDWFYADDIVEKIISAADANDYPDVIYGNVVGVEREVLTVFSSSDANLESSMICHQALFSLTSLMKERKFDLNYKIAADYKFVLGLKVDGKRFMGVDLIIAYFSCDGISSVDIKGRYAEHTAVQVSYGISTNKKDINKRIVKESIAQKVKNKLPRKLWLFWSIRIKKKTLLEKF